LRVEMERDHRTVERVALRSLRTFAVSRDTPGAADSARRATLR